MSSIPKHAKRVFKGIIFQVYQWPQKMFDGSTVIFERVWRQSTVVIIAETGGKIALLKQKQPGLNWFYDFPSGRMDKVGESPKQAALRELKEETGLVPKTIKLWKTYSPSGKINQNVYFFVARGCKKVSQQKLDPGEKISVSYISFEQMLKVSDHPRCFFGPLMIDILMARIHKESKDYLKKSIFSNWQTPPKPAKYGPKTNW